MDIWIDVGMWTGLSGTVQPFIDVRCDPPEQVPTDAQQWQEWALAHLRSVGADDDWQPGRYHYTVEQRDDEGRPTTVFARGIYER